MFSKVRKAYLLALVVATISFIATRTPVVNALAQYVTVLGILQLDQNEIHDSNSVFRLGVGSRNFINGPIAHGNSRTVASITLPADATTNDFSRQLPVYNPTASTISQGSLLISSDTGTTFNAYVNVAPATADLTTIIGVAAEDITTASNGFMIPRGGGFALMLTTGTVTQGNALVSSGTVAGRAGADATPTTGADIAIALEDGAAAGELISVLMH